MTKLQQKIWEIAWTIWDHQNRHLQNDTRKIHQYDLSEINTEIIKDLLKGSANLLPRYKRLFWLGAEERLGNNIDKKDNG